MKNTLDKSIITSKEERGKSLKLVISDINYFLEIVTSIKLGDKDIVMNQDLLRTMIDMGIIERCSRFKLLDNEIGILTSEKSNAEEKIKSNEKRITNLGFFDKYSKKKGIEIEIENIRKRIIEIEQRINEITNDLKVITKINGDYYLLTQGGFEQLPSKKGSDLYYQIGMKILLRLGGNERGWYFNKLMPTINTLLPIACENPERTDELIDLYYNACELLYNKLGGNESKWKWSQIFPSINAIMPSIAINPNKIEEYVDMYYGIGNDMKVIIGGESKGYYYENVMPVTNIIFREAVKNPDRTQQLIEQYYLSARCLLDNLGGKQDGWNYKHIFQGVSYIFKLSNTNNSYNSQDKPLNNGSDLYYQIGMKILSRLGGNKYGWYFNNIMNIVNTLLPIAYENPERTDELIDLYDKVGKLLYIKLWGNGPKSRWKEIFPYVNAMIPIIVKNPNKIEEYVDMYFGILYKMKVIIGGENKGYFYNDVMPAANIIFKEAIKNPDRTQQLIEQYYLSARCLLDNLGGKQDGWNYKHIFSSVSCIFNTSSVIVRFMINDIVKNQNKNKQTINTSGDVVESIQLSFYDIFRRIIFINLFLSRDNCENVSSGLQSCDQNYFYGDINIDTDSFPTFQMKNSVLLDELSQVDGELEGTDGDGVSSGFDDSNNTIEYSSSEYSSSSFESGRSSFD